MSLRPKICIVSATPLSIRFFLTEHIKRLSVDNDVYLFTNLIDDAYVDLDSLPIKVIPLKLHREIRLYSDFIGFIRLLWLLHKYQFDFVWGIGPKAGLISMLAGKLAGIRSRLFVFQGEVWASKRGVFRAFLKFCDALTAWCASKVLAVSHPEMDFLVEEGVVNASRIGVLGKGSISGVALDFSQSDRGVLRAKFGIKEDDFVLLFVGRLHKDKGLVELADAYRILANEYLNLRLVILGPDEGALTEVESVLGLLINNCLIYGYTEDVDQFYRMADVFCLPSYREGMPISVLEASSYGLPVVASDIYGIRGALVGGETGLLHQSGSVAEMVSCLKVLIEHPELRERLGRCGRAMVEEDFNRHVVVGRYVALINEMIAKRH